MPIIRVKKDKDNPYVMVNKKYLENPKLSWKAKGLMTYLLSRPDDWIVFVEQLVKTSKDNRSSTDTGIKELIKEGYILRREEERIKGQFKGYDYTVYEKPQRKINNGKNDSNKPVTKDSPLSVYRSGSTAAEKPYTENQQLLSNDNTNNDITNIKIPAKAGEKQPTEENKLFKQYLDYFHEKYLKKFQIKFKWIAKECKQIKNIIKQIKSLEEFKKICDTAFRDKFWGDRVTPTVLYSNLSFFLKGGSSDGRPKFGIEDAEKSRKQAEAAGYTTMEMVVKRRNKDGK